MRGAVFRAFIVIFMGISDVSTGRSDVAFFCSGVCFSKKEVNFFHRDIYIFEKEICFFLGKVLFHEGNVDFTEISFAFFDREVYFCCRNIYFLDGDVGFLNRCVVSRRAGVARRRRCVSFMTALIKPLSSPAQVPHPDAALLLKAVGDPLRWRILAELAAGEPLMVKELAERVGVSRAVASKQMAVLRRAGAVVVGRGRLYQIPPGHLVAAELRHVDYGHCLLRLPAGR
jgi:DNA-binding transcriptional ArsR family regulator